VEEQISSLLNNEDQLVEVLPGIIAYYESRITLSDRDLATRGETRQEIADRLVFVNRLCKENA
jgi:hypothetical protein